MSWEFCPIVGSFGFFIIIARPLQSLFESSTDFLIFVVAVNDESWLWSMYEPGPGKSDVETPKWSSNLSFFE